MVHMTRKNIILLMVIVLLSFSFYILSSPYRMNRIDKFVNNEEKQVVDVKGKILTDDNVTVTYTERVYSLTFLGTLYNKEEFENILNAINRVKTININSAMKRYFRNTKKEYKVILYGFNEKNIKKVKEILQTQDTKRKYAFKLSGERRIYPYGNFLTPVLGYNKKTIDKKTNYTYLEGVNGLEKSYNTILSATSLAPAKDIYLSIDFKMQRDLEKEVDELKALYDAREVTSVILNTDTFRVKAFASSNRYNPKHIQRKDFANLSIHALQYLFKLGKFSTLFKDIHVELDKPSGIDLPYERVYNNKNIQEIQNYKVNFVQLVKAYTPLYSGGYIGTPKIERSQDVHKKQILSQALSYSLKKKADIFFDTMPGKTFTLELKDENISAAIYMKSFTQDNHQYMQAYFSIYNEQEIPFEVKVDLEASSSNQYFEATIYSKKDNHKIGKIIQPINKYQANRRNGSEREIVGIYKANDGNYYIDAITTKGTPTASSNAEQTYNVETLKITDDKIESMNIREFNIATYKPLK